LSSQKSGIILVMKPLFVRELTSEEREALTKGLRSSQLFTVKRCQILLASARGLNATQIAETIGCSTQNVRMVRAIVEPTRTLTADELESHVCGYYGCSRTKHLQQHVH
jgi:hypothetical protein